MQSTLSDVARRNRCWRLGVLLLVPSLALAQAGGHAVDHAAHSAAVSTAPPAHLPDETRQTVGFPAGLLAHTLANMRDHLLAITEILAALAGQRYDAAADIAEQRLGMSSLQSHGAHEVAKYMPPGMRDAGTAMHRAASRFALTAQEAAVDRDTGRALAGLAEVTQSCVACHAAYRLVTH